MHLTTSDTNIACIRKKIIVLTDHDGGGSVMVCLAASGSGRLAVIDRITNPGLFQKPVCDLMLKGRGVMQKDISDWLKKETLQTDQLKPGLILNVFSSLQVALEHQSRKIKNIYRLKLFINC